MSQQQLQTDVVIIGAGIAGLWLHHRLNDLGFHALLLESGKIGQGQTLSAQGIIHGGSKYALNGILSTASQVISHMPARWKACLIGQGDIDLRDVNKLTDHQLLWSSNKLSSKMVSFFASKALQSRMQALKNKDYPEFFQHPDFHGSLYQLDEPVLDVPSLLSSLTKKWQKRMLKIPVHAELSWQQQENTYTHLTIGNHYQISAQHFVLTAGEGNEAILASLNCEQPKMQRRPLQMLLCKSQNQSKPLPIIYAHSLGSGSKPIATISSHLDHQNNVVWYLGGNIAEEGVGKDKNSLIEEAKTLLSTILPWVDLPDLQWTTHAVNRAEPKQSSLTRPDSAYCHSHQNVHICWPTKLALTPNLSDQLLSKLTQSGIQPQHYNNPEFPTPDIAVPLWDRAFQ